MREAILYARVNGTERLRCDICQWHCQIGSGHLGRCRVRLNRNGVLYSLTYGMAAAIHVDPIEKKPLFHFYPASKVLSLGSLGCNYRCVHCQNWQLSFAEPAADEGTWQVAGHTVVAGESISPTQAVELAAGSGCAGICWTYNEPTVWFEYTLASAKLAKAKGLYTAYVTNGYMSPEALDTIGPHLDAFRIDVKGFGDSFYRRLTKVPSWRGLLEVAARARNRWGMHVEVVTNVIPTMNDDWQLKAIAEWIKTDLGAETPWHVTAFHPDAFLTDVPATSLETLLRARDTGLKAGLRYVYTGNIIATNGEHTVCPGCGALAIERLGYRTRVVGVAEGGCCARCGEGLNVRGI